MYLEKDLVASLKFLLYNMKECINFGTEICYELITSIKILYFLFDDEFLIERSVIIFSVLFPPKITSISAMYTSLLD